jgi:hypothetical protein
MDYAEDRDADPNVAFEIRTSRYDYFALDLNVMFAASDHRVTETMVSDNGFVVIEAGSVRFEAMPGRQGGAWRLDRIVGAGG